MTSVSVQRKRVLIVEDEPAAREASERFLQFVGYEVDTAANAKEALMRAAEDRPDVVVCDWRLGDGPDGADVARELQQRYGTSIILMTAHPIDELRDVTDDIRVAKYFRKPVQLSQLAKAVEATND